MRSSVVTHLRQCLVDYTPFIKGDVDSTAPDWWQLLPTDSLPAEEQRRWEIRKFGMEKLWIALNHAQNDMKRVVEALQMDGEEYMAQACQATYSATCGVLYVFDDLSDIQTRTSCDDIKYSLEFGG